MMFRAFVQTESFTARTPLILWPFTPPLLLKICNSWEMVKLWHELRLKWLRGDPQELCIQLKIYYWQSKYSHLLSWTFKKMVNTTICTYFTFPEKGRPSVLELSYHAPLVHDLKSSVGEGFFPFLLLLPLHCHTFLLLTIKQFSHSPSFLRFRLLDAVECSSLQLFLVS